MSGKAVKRHFHLSVSDSQGNHQQTEFPNRVTVTDESSLKVAISFDHVCAEMKNGKRKTDNFLSTDCLFADVDNDNTSSDETMKAWDDPDKHMTIERFQKIFSDYEYIIYTSRNHMKDKIHGESLVRTAREKFHVLFPLGVDIRDADEVKTRLTTLIESFRRDDGLPYFDPALKDPCRLLFGVDECEIIWHEGKSIVDYLDNCKAMDAINQSSVSGEISGRFIVEVLPKLKVIDVFTGIDFRSSGPNQLLGRCPFHLDTNPSFSVDSKRFLWICHAGCGSGNAAQYLMKRDNIQYKEAERRLYELAGVEYQSAEQGDDPVQRLLKISRSMEMFRSSDDSIVAMIEFNGRLSPVKITSEKFKEWLTAKYYKIYGKNPSSADLNTAIIILKQPEQTLEGKETFLRIGRHGNSLYLDLCDDAGNVVEITGNGWKVIQYPPVYFERKDGMKSLCTPIKGGSINDLRPLLNLKSENDWILMVGWILGTFMVGVDYPILVIRGDQGSGKSCMTGFIRNLVDPNSNPVNSLPKDKRNLMIDAMNAHILAYDNISRISGELSDNLSSLATGIGMSDRKLYSDDEKISFYGSRPIILNGIEFSTKDDLADRFISINISRIPGNRRLNKSDLNKKLEEIMPGVLGAICDAVSSILKNYKNVNLQRKNRMADFETFVTAAEEYLGWGQGLFSEVFTQNVKQTKEGLINEDYLSGAVIDFMEDHSGNQWSGNATELLEELKNYEDIQYLPKSPSLLSRGLTRRISNLRDYGIYISKIKKQINIKKI